jgi:hypothetical protein
MTSDVDNNVGQRSPLGPVVRECVGRGERVYVLPMGSRSLADLAIFLHSEHHSYLPWLDLYNSIFQARERSIKLHENEHRQMFQVPDNIVDNLSSSGGSFRRNAMPIMSPCALFVMSRSVSRISVIITFIPTAISMVPSFVCWCSCRPLG